MTILKLFITALFVCFALVSANAQKLGALVATNALQSTDTIPVTTDAGANTFKVAITNLMDPLWLSLVLKADLASPALTGNPTVPNVILSDSDTTIANTAFVKSNILAVAASTVTNSFGISIDGGGAPITTGVKGYATIPNAGTITKHTMLVDQTGSAIVDIWKCTYAQFDAGATHPVAGDKITASAPPTILGATKATDSTLTGWTLAVAKGDVVAFSVTAITNITRLNLTVEMTH